MVDNPSAPPGKATKYARREYERRFLLAEPPPGHVVQSVAVSDRYLIGTRLRLRRLDGLEPVGQEPVFKLTQKVAAADGGPGLITNTYLCLAEFDLLATLPGQVLTKTRHSVPPLGIDVFAGDLTGLVLAEAEFETEAECQAFVAPRFVVAEVTADPRFTGGVLAGTDAAGIRDALRTFGL